MPHAAETVTIALLEPSRATDAAIVDELVEIVNTAYAVGEAGMWVDGTSRITAEGLRDLIRASEIMVALDGSRAVGCVRLHRIDESTWGFGMLAAARSAHGTGIGRRLVESVEAAAREAGASEMQLELLVPTEGVQESKAVLADWYSRAGYRRVSSKPMAEDYPELAVSLAIACDYQIWRKPLA